MQHGKWLACGRRAVGTPKRKHLILLLRSFGELGEDQQARKLSLWVLNYDRGENSRG